ncbi:hypothetical protein JG688_00013133 [Phytophthora aleatoria]|uniref:Uncharacterized protein n=1 Tax=Phytophthora aleatoria TaxID=2496075 RepID=A0A8J5M1H1_9STRA|nr:hypothetical protein JG688_00013133 [Phytophthora aleatoria]
MKLEGITFFPERPGVSYRYSIELKNSRMSIWMEDRKNKTQWYRGGVPKADVISSGNEIPNASATDYAKVKLKIFDDGTIRLDLAIEIDFLRTSWVAKFAFELNPVSVEQIDVLESKLRDQQDALERLEKEVKLLRADQEPIFIQLKASRKHETTSNLCWDKQESVSFIVNKGSGEIKITRSGVYSIHGTLICYPIDDDGRMMLLKNKECILTVDILDSLNYVERLEKGDVLEHWRMDLLLEHGTGKW